MTGEKETICPIEDTQPASSKPKPWHWMARSWLLATNTVISTGPKRDCLSLLIIYVCQFPHLLASCCPQLGFQTIRSRTSSWPQAAKHLKILNFIYPLYNIQIQYYRQSYKNIANTLETWTQHWRPLYPNILEIRGGSKNQLLTLRTEDEIICHISQMVNEFYCNIITLFTLHCSILHVEM